MTDTIKQFGKQDFFSSVLVSCSSKNQVPYLLNKGCNQLKFDISAAQGEKKNNTLPAFRVRSSNLLQALRRRIFFFFFGLA